MLAILFTVALLQSSTSDCTTADACRAQALIAEAAGNFETFHDLAWRAVQRGKPNNPELMTVLARAMAESGRPGDAIVMLSRIADMGVSVDTSGDEYRVVRTLKDWPAVAAKFAALSNAAATARTGVAPPSPPAETPHTADVAPHAAASSAPAPREPVAPGEPLLLFDTPTFTPAGLAYDAVSRRFIVGDPAASKLLVVDQQSHHVVPLVSAAAAGFYDRIASLTIDPRRGDLWVVSSKTDGEGDASAVHKLQLVSGRTLMDVQATGLGDVRLIDVAVTASGTVYALDAAGRRILRLRPGSRTLDVAATVSSSHELRALAVEDDRVAFVADRERLLRVDLATGRSVPVPAAEDVSDLSALQRSGDTLYAVRHGSQLLEVQLDQGDRRVASVRAVDAASAVAVSGNHIYYLCPPGQIKVLRR